MRKLGGLICLLVLIVSCSANRRITDGISSIRFVGEFTLPHKLQFNGTTVGGLSSIDYDSAAGVYYLICDDRSDTNPARFYTAKIAISNKGIDTVQLLAVTTLLQANGEVYPNRKQDSFHVPDPEALRYNPINKTLVWSSEGERKVRGENSILTDPAIIIMGMDGRYRDSFPIPANMRMQKEPKGPRQNGVFEGLAFTPGYKSLFVSLEEPLYEDGLRAGLGDSTGWIRLIKYAVETRQPVAQYAYQIDPVVEKPVPVGAFVVNGVPDILAINDHQLLVTERSFSTGRNNSNIRIYLAGLQGAEDISGVASLAETPTKHPVRKKLLLNMDKLNRWIDNIEGASFGPRLPNGKRSLLFVADDNFSEKERNQFLLFEVE